MSVPNVPPQAGAHVQKVFTLEYPQSVAVYSTYHEAQRAVDFLADKKFPVQHLAIVGTGLTSVERVLGRKTWGKVLANGAISGIGTGLLVALMLMLFTAPTSFLAVLLTGLFIGVAMGMVTAALSYSTSRGERDFTSVQQTSASRYEVFCEHSVAQQAREMVATMTS